MMSLRTSLERKIGLVYMSGIMMKCGDIYVLHWRLPRRRWRRGQKGCSMMRMDRLLDG